MWVRLKDENGIVSLVNLSQAKYIQPAAAKNDDPAIRIVWSHDTFTDHGDLDLPDESCTYSEQIFTGVTVPQIEMLLGRVGLTYPPTENGAEKKQVKEEAPEVSNEEEAPEPEAEQDDEEQPAKKSRKRS